MKEKTISFKKIFFRVLPAIIYITMWALVLWFSLKDVDIAKLYSDGAARARYYQTQEDTLRDQDRG